MVSGRYPGELLAGSCRDGRPPGSDSPCATASSIWPSCFIETVRVLGESAQSSNHPATRPQFDVSFLLPTSSLELAAGRVLSGRSAAWIRLSLRGCKQDLAVALFQTVRVPGGVGPIV